MSAFDDPDGNLPGWRGETGGDSADQTVEQVWTVSEINRFVRDVLARAAGAFWARGEVSNLTIHRSGHVYLTLKDAKSQVSVVYFRGAADARAMALQEGMEVDVYGRLSVYEPRGQYQIIAERLRPCGAGALRQRIEELKKKLRAEGLFDPDRKRDLPVLPRTVGVVTSPQGAALQDFLQVIGRRFASLHVRIVPAAVQGEGAAGQVAAGVDWLNRTEACDVIVVTRGGGSLEDLMAFNDEALVRTIAKSAIPVLSAVGHEVDVTLCDLVADMRAPTPSAAAEQVIRTKSELAERVRTARDRLQSRLRLRLQSLEHRVHRAARSPVFYEPAHLIGVYRQQVDALTARGVAAMQWRMRQDAARIDRQKASLQALNPGRVLERGYAIITPVDGGESITDAARTEVGQEVRAVLARGQLKMRVTEKSETPS